MDEPSAPSSVPPAPRRIAVVVNGNAKSVTEEVISTLDQILLGGDLFVSRALEEMGDIAATIVTRGYGTVLTGGGDGTFTTVVSEVVRQARRRGRPLPRFGFLKLGTGNALAHVVGASGTDDRGFAADIHRLRVDAGSREIGLVEVEDVLTPFCGFGLDAVALKDYDKLKARLSGTPLARFGAGKVGYALAAATRTLPKSTVQKLANYRILNLGGEARRIDVNGKALGPPIKEGEVIYDGPARLVGISTIPYYGFGFRAFPQACERAGKMQLRISNIGPLSFVRHFGDIWSGAYNNLNELHDYWVDDCRIDVTPATPFQIGGDYSGERSSVRARLSRDPIRLVDFYAPPNPE